MLQRRLLRSLCGWRITTPCIRIRGWATAHRGNTSSLVLNPPRVRSNGGNSTFNKLILEGRARYAIRDRLDQLLEFSVDTLQFSSSGFKRSPSLDPGSIHFSCVFVAECREQCGI